MHHRKMLLWGGGFWQCWQGHGVPPGPFFMPGSGHGLQQPCVTRALAELCPATEGTARTKLRPQTGRCFGILLPFPKYIWASGGQARVGTPQDKQLRFLMGFKLVRNQSRWDPLIQCRLTFLRGSQEKQAAIQKGTEEQRREVGDERGNGKKHEATSSIRVSSRGLPSQH